MPLLKVEKEDGREAPEKPSCLKYLRSTTLGCQDIGIRIFEFVAKTQFLS